MKRRGMLLGLATAFVAVPEVSPERALLGLFADHARGVALGRAYVAGLPAPPTSAALARTVWSGLSGRGGLRRQVTALIVDDFARGRVICLDGWVLSVTEARICGVSALARA